MKRWIFLSLWFSTIFVACEKKSAEDELLDSENLLASQEYFRAEINGEPFEVTDPETMGGTIYPSPNSGVITFDLYGAIEEEDHFEALDFKICFFEGPGTYYTGTTTSVSWADYYLNWDMWYNDYTLKDPGTVTVSTHSEKFIEGTFEFNAFNYEQESYVHVTGEFKVLLEKSVYDE